VLVVAVAAVLVQARVALAAQRMVQAVTQLPQQQTQVAVAVVVVLAVVTVATVVAV